MFDKKNPHLHEQIIYCSIKQRAVTLVHHNIKSVSYVW